MKKNEVAAKELHRIAFNLEKYGVTEAQDIKAFAQEIQSQERPEFNPSHEAPPIESFVKRRPEEMPVRKVHTATVGFIAQGDQVAEDEIMQYILAIRDALPVKVKSFNWSVTDDKKSSAKAAYNFVRHAQSMHGGDQGDNVSPQQQEEPSNGGGRHFDPSDEAPPIESFVKRQPEEMPVRKIHTATVGFIAQGDQVAEDEIMQYILAIRDHLPVKVKSFNWSVTDDKKTA